MAPAANPQAVTKLHRNEWAAPLYTGSYHDYIIVEGGRGSSKALRDDTPIATPEGWTEIANLRPGDEVYGVHGMPVTVTGVYPQGMRDEWRVGVKYSEPLYADGEHLWRTLDASFRSFRNKHKLSFRGWTEREPITTKAISETLTYGGRGDLNHAIPLAEPLCCPDADLPIHPYVLGAWLGDGSSYNAMLTVSRDDAPHFRERFAECGETLHDPMPCTADKPAPNYPISKSVERGGTKDHGNTTLRARLVALGVLENKHIPMAYLRASTQQRLALLAGLVDTDGTLKTRWSEVSITCANKRLANGIHELVVSLGRRASFIETRAKLNGKDCGPVWHIMFYPLPGCATLPRKKERIREPRSQQSRWQTRMVESVAPTGRKVPMTCIAVDAPNRMYLAGKDLVPTHNTHEFTQALAYRGAMAPLRICVAREHLRSIDESAKPELEARMQTMGLIHKDAWTPYRTSIDHVNGSHIFFIGLSKVSEEDIKGLALVDILWIEEAQRMSRASWILIRPTIRKDGAQIWASYNATRYDDAIYEFAHGNKDDPLVLFKQISFRDNAFFTGRNERDRLRDKRDDPDLYQHIWEGVPFGDGDARKVLTYNMVQDCIKAWEKYVGTEDGAWRKFGRIDAGLDVADTGTDRNALVARCGPCMIHAERFNSEIPADTARRGDNWCREHGVRRMYYDTQPAGAIRGPLTELSRKEGKRPYGARGVNFGGEVQGKETEFNNQVTNEQMFYNRSAQMYWGLHMRARNTQRLMSGRSDIDPADCLFINPDILNHRDNRRFLVRQLSQPIWEETTAGKTKIEKQPKEAEGRSTKLPSPDLADAAALAYSADSDDDRGLRARR